ncbi:hypothetical protein BSZ43_14725 [Bacillus sp. H15-1]|nr:hypothetical protein BSZ43_14725 [Bacillus sp. H15-1]
MRPHGRNPKTLLVSVVNFDEAEEKALNLALNKISGDWDDYKLEQVLEDLQHNNFDLSLQASQKVK